MTVIVFLQSTAPNAAFGAVVPISAPDLENAPSASIPDASADQTPVQRADGPHFSLAISPTRISVGQDDIGKIQKITVLNNGNSTIPIQVGKRDFTVSAAGALTFQDHDPYSASDWVALDPTSFELKAGARQIVTAKVTVPEKPDVGDHQVALVFLVPAGAEQGNIKVNRGIAAPMYVTVPGAIDDSVTLKNLAAPGFATGGPVTITASVKNIGTVHRDYRGEAPLVVDAPGDAVPFPDFTVGRGVTRDISTTWDPPWIGVFNPKVTLVNSDGTTQSQSVQVIVFPIQKALILVGVLLLLFFGFWFVRRRYRASVRKAAVAMNRPASGGDA